MQYAWLIFHGLQILHLADNMLTGPIDQAIESMHFLSTLLVGSNQLTGPLPAAMATSRLQVLSG